MNKIALHEGISVVILIRTDTTLDHSQKAEKVCSVGICPLRCAALNNTEHPPFGEFRVELSLREKFISRISAPPSRQPLVKGERLVRTEMSAAMIIIDLGLVSIRGENCSPSSHHR